MKRKVLYTFSILLALGGLQAQSSFSKFTSSVRNVVTGQTKCKADVVSSLEKNLSNPDSTTFANSKKMLLKCVGDANRDAKKTAKYRQLLRTDHPEMADALANTCKSNAMFSQMFAPQCEIALTNGSAGAAVGYVGNGPSGTMVNGVCQCPGAGQAGVTAGQPAMVQQVSYGQPGTPPQVAYGQPGTMPQVTYGQPAGMPTYGQVGTMPQVTYGQPGTPNQITYGQPAGMPTYGQPAAMPQMSYGQPAAMPSYGQPYSGGSYGAYPSAQAYGVPQGSYMPQGYGQSVGAGYGAGMGYGSGMPQAYPAQGAQAAQQPIIMMLDSSTLANAVNGGGNNNGGGYGGNQGNAQQNAQNSYIQGYDDALKTVEQQVRSDYK